MSGPDFLQQCRTMADAENTLMERVACALLRCNVDLERTTWVRRGVVDPEVFGHLRHELLGRVDGTEPRVIARIWWKKLTEYQFELTLDLHDDYTAAYEAELVRARREAMI